MGKLEEEYGSGWETLFHIIDFYVINTPVPGTSNRGRSFKQMGWIKGKANSLQAEMRRKSTLGDAWICDKPSTLETHLARIDDGGSHYREHAIYVKGGSKNNRSNTKTKALFYGIRCAFAHGSFTICEHAGERWYKLENRYQGKLRGHFLLKEKTLLAWEALITAGPTRLTSGVGIKRKRTRKNKN